MQTPTPFPPSYPPARPASGKNGMITIGFIFSLIAFTLILIHAAVQSFLSSPILTTLRVTREVWNLMTYLPAILGLIGTLGFLFSLIGTLSELSKRTLSQHFAAFTGMGLGFFSFLIMIEYSIRTIQILIR